MPEPALPPDAGELVVIARLGRAKGLKGEIYANGWAEPDRYHGVRRVWLQHSDGTFARDGAATVFESVRAMHGRLVMKFEGISTMSDAEVLTGCSVVVPKAERPELPEGEFYLADLVGCEVFDSRSGSKVGRVTGWQEFGGPELLEIQPEGSAADDAVWVPFARSICVEIDVNARRLVIDPPEGLLELNA